ncbi:zinc finger protein ZXDC isoform X1 [Dasypus novemcinctus]|uniref:zinc finger protein ZXDC isoform X1 n=1 Tax=Dasypus novemcinctus TaxID=9361 RepID=UPI00265F4DF1|nr:zinc finger protein ZXDC isoform X1 [Dasypus novemcinctus]
MELPGPLAARTSRGGPAGGDGSGRLRRGPGPPGSPGPARRRLLLLRGPEDGGSGPRREEAPAASELGPPPAEDGGAGDSFVVLLEVARGSPAEAPERRDTEPGPGPTRGGRSASAAARPGQGPSGPPAAPGPAAAFAGTITINNQDLLVCFDNGVFTLAAPPPPGPQPGVPPAPPGALLLAEPAAILTSGEEAARAAEGRCGAPGAGPGAPTYRCPEPQCAQTFAKKHQLKVHLLTHGSSQGRRPFKCPLDGCGWAFTTSYKLKRHLQSHDKLRPFSCPVGGCGKKFTTIYNLKAHMKGHEQNLFKCEVCAERFPTHAKLSSHQRSHFEPERPYKCDFPGCEKTFITVSALFSHNRAHFREQELFSCSFPGCSKQYDKACRLKIHLRSHTGERPFICDSDSCGWTFTSMSKLLRHKRKHDDDRRFTCPVEGCGKSFTRAEHLKGHSITHLGTKPFECPVEGCCARFSARSSLYIHSKKHLQDVDASKSRCPVSSCNRRFTSKHSMKTHMVRQHNLRQDLLTQLEATSSLTPSSELTSPGQNELNNIDLVSLFSNASGTGNSSAVASDMALVNSGILTIDVTSMSSSLGGNVPANNNPLGQMDPLVLVANSDIPPSLESPLVLGSAATVLQPSNLNMDDVHTVSAEALGCLVSLPVKNSSQDPQALTSGSGNLALNLNSLTPASSPSGNSSVPGLLTPVKVEQNLPAGSDDVGPQEGSKVVTQFVFSNPAENYNAQKDSDLSAVAGNLYLLCDLGQPRFSEYKWCLVNGLQESGGSARTDYRAIQLVKEKKQKGTENNAGSAGSTQRKNKGGKVSPPHSHPSRSSWLCGSLVVPSGGLTVPGPVAGAQRVHIQLLQDEPSSEGVLPLVSSLQPSMVHPVFAVDLPVYVLQEVLPAPVDTAGPEGAWLPQSTINLQDLQ